MSGERGGPMLKAAGLWAKSSAKGGQYLTGRLGGVKVLENRDRKSDDEPSHHLTNFQRSILLRYVVEDGNGAGRRAELCRSQMRESRNGHTLEQLFSQ
jgi:hypothetical protein